MFTKSFTLAVATVATLATAQIGTAGSAHADPGAAVAAGVVGLAGGLILGSALADGARADPGPGPDEVIVRRRPARVIEEEEVVVPPPPRCWREQWHDRWGDLHIRRVCDR